MLGPPASAAVVGGGAVPGTPRNCGLSVLDADPDFAGSVATTGLESWAAVRADTLPPSAALEATMDTPDVTVQLVRPWLKFKFVELRGDAPSVVTFADDSGPSADTRRSDTPLLATTVVSSVTVSGGTFNRTAEPAWTCAVPEIEPQPSPTWYKTVPDAGMSPRESLTVTVIARSPTRNCAVPAIATPDPSTTCTSTTFQTVTNGPNTVNPVLLNATRAGGTGSPFTVTIAGSVSRSEPP